MLVTVYGLLIHKKLQRTLRSGLIGVEKQPAFDI